ncbi:MAG: hypothetical protein PHU36_03560 [Syntrophomonadaceae bacterium]|nr:hypothetical protein [Syntrophomonadaceae bacterium]
MKVLMIFIDGFGLGSINENNPYYFAGHRFWIALLAGIFFIGKPERFCGKMQ